VDEPVRRGRHAAHRAGPAALLSLAPAQLATAAVLVAVALGATCWWLVRGTAHPSSDLAAAPTRALVTATAPTGPADPGSRDPAARDSPATVTVDVAGKVRHPGIAVLDAGARVVDALEAAGGARRGVDLSSLNLARVLVDGEQVLVGEPPANGTAGPAAGSGAAAPAPGAPASLVDLNTATEAELETLPEVGPVTAAAIAAWRDEHGGFTSVEELVEVDGIGEATLARLAPYVTV